MTQTFSRRDVLRQGLAIAAAAGIAPALGLAAGRYGEEDWLFQPAGQLEQASPWFDRLPPS